jgi:hypothetical protein
MYAGFKQRRPQMEDDLKILNFNISATTDQIFLKFKLNP